MLFVVDITTEHKHVIDKPRRLSKIFRSGSSTVSLTINYITIETSS